MIILPLNPQQLFINAVTYDGLFKKLITNSISVALQYLLNLRAINGSLSNINELPVEGFSFKSTKTISSETGKASSL
mgnify:CR=1 FL=1